MALVLILVLILIRVAVFLGDKVRSSLGPALSKAIIEPEYMTTVEIRALLGFCVNLVKTITIGAT